MMLTLTRLFACTVLCAAVFGLGEESTLPLVERINAYVAHAGSGDHLGPDFEKELVIDLQRAPKDVLGFLRSRVQPVDEYVTLSATGRKTHLGILRLYILCCEEGRELAAQQLRKIAALSSVRIKAQGAEPRPDNANEDVRQAKYLLQTVIIRALGEMRDARILADVLSLYGTGDRAIRNDIVRYYLEPLVGQDEEARTSVRNALDDENSPVEVASNPVEID